METDYISLSEAQDAMTGENLIRNLDQVENGEAKRYARAAIRVLEQLEPADVRPAWRSTETDPPKIGEPVLIARKIRYGETVLVEPAVLRPDGNWKAIGHKIKQSSVRRWMPMPEPPEEV